MEEIKAEDIMIGNYIRDRWSENGFFKVTEIRKDKVFYGNCFKARYEDLVPIPLTEDILLNAGFEFDYKGFIYKEPIDGYRMRLRTGDGVFEYRLNTNYSIKIQYLHQLQNLFKSLTGNELEINL